MMRVNLITASEIMGSDPSLSSARAYVVRPQCSVGWNCTMRSDLHLILQFLYTDLDTNM